MIPVKRRRTTSTSLTKRRTSIRVAQALRLAKLSTILILRLGSVTAIFPTPPSPLEHSRLLLLQSTWLENLPSECLLTMHLSSFKYPTCALPYVNIFTVVQEVKPTMSRDVDLLLLAVTCQLQDFKSGRKFGCNNELSTTWVQWNPLRRSLFLLHHNKMQVEPTILSLLAQGLTVTGL